MSARRRSRRPWIVAAVVVVFLVLGGGGLVRFHETTETRVARNRCHVTSKGGHYTIDAQQARLAATIAAVGARRGMVNHAVTVAFATALQESGLRNLGGGHLDSVGLFQQRPSQGWGTEVQLLDPLYAADRFYAALADVPGWERLPVTVAAQRVQRSAHPDGYARHETQARVMASAFTGEVPAGVTCELGPPVAGSGAVEEQQLREAVTRELGSRALAAPRNTQRGWAAANWLVAHAYGTGLTSVRYADQTWERARHAWVPSPPVASVSFTLAR
jgi:hypothetical protein